MPQFDREEIRQYLEERRVHLIDRNDRVDNDLSHRTQPLSADSGERAAQLENDEALQEIRIVTTREIQAIDAALKRLSLDLHDICSICGDEISAPRLQALPHAVTCAHCATR